MRMTPRQEQRGTQRYRSQISTDTTPWWTTALEKEFCMLGTAATKLHTLSLGIESRAGSKSPVAGWLLQNTQTHKREHIIAIALNSIKL